MKHSISTHHHRTRVLSLLCTFAIFASLIPVVSAEPQMVDLDTLKKHVVSNTATELKSNLGKYLLLAATEDIFITRNGKVVAKLSNPHQDRVDIAKSLFGILPADVTLEEAKEERLNRI